MAWIKKQITYNVPDQRHSMVATEGKSSTQMYNGPNKLIIWLSKTDHTEGEPYDKNDIMHVWDVDDMTERPMPSDCYEAILDCAKNDENCVKCAMLAPKGGFPDDNCLEIPKLYEVAVGPVNQLNKIIRDPSHIMKVYAKQDIAVNAYDEQTGKWKDLKYRTGETEDRTDESIRSIRNSKLVDSDNMFNSDMPDEMIKEWHDYRQTLRDIPQDWKDVPNDLIQFPTEPGTKDVRYDETTDDIIWIADRSAADADALKQIKNIPNVE